MQPLDNPPAPRADGPARVDIAIRELAIREFGWQIGTEQEGAFWAINPLGVPSWYGRLESPDGGVRQGWIEGYLGWRTSLDAALRDIEPVLLRHYIDEWCVNRNQTGTYGARVGDGKWVFDGRPQWAFLIAAHRALEKKWQEVAV